MIKLQNPGVAKAQIGENSFSILVLDRETFQPIKDAGVTVRASRELIPVTSHGNAYYLANVAFKKSGIYEVQVHIMSGDKEDVSVLPVSF